MKARRFIFVIGVMCISAAVLIFRIQSKSVYSPTSSDVDPTIIQLENNSCNPFHTQKSTQKNTPTHPLPGPVFANTSLPLSESSLVESNIFFLHFNEDLTNPRYLCAVESALRLNPLHSVHLYAVNSIGFEIAMKPWLRKMLSEEKGLYTRFFLRELEWLPPMIDTPLEKWFTSGAYKDSSWVLQNLGNAFRMALLYQYGGVYMDLDIISLKSIGGLGRAISMQDKDWFNNAIFSFPRKDEFLYKMMAEFVKGFKGHIWARNGPRMVTRTFKYFCSAKNVHSACVNLHVMPTSKFFPVQYEHRKQLFDLYDTQCNLLRRLENESIGLHWWNKKAQSKLISDKSVLAVIMKAQCPMVFETFSDDELGFFNSSVAETKLRKGFDDSLSAKKLAKTNSKEELSLQSKCALRNATAGVEVETLIRGKRDRYPKDGDSIKIRWTGRFSNGTRLPIPSENDFIAVVGSGRMIRGLDEGVRKLNEGSKALLRIASDFAYGSGGIEGAIPPDTHLCLEVHLLEIH